MTMFTAADFPISPRHMERQLKVLQATYFRNPQEQNPEVVYIAGQPASGKSTVIESIRSGHTVLDSDELRKLHPALDEIMHLDPLRMDVLTNGPVAFWMSELIEYGRQHSHSMIIENSLSNPRSIANEITKFRNNGFKIHIVALAVAQEVSRLGIVQRYLEAKRTSPHPRWTNEISHTNGYKAIIPGLNQLHSMVDSLEIRTRDGRYLNSIEEIETERTQWFSSPETRQAWLTSFDACDLTEVNAEKLTANLRKDAQTIRSW